MSNYDSRIGGWMQTRSGVAYFHQDPRPNDIRLTDIAHALSNICRFGGHTERFYSVAEHSVLVSQVVPPEHAMIGLMHDATEAYVIDVPRPLKHMLGKVYSDLEDKTWAVICEKFGLDPDMPSCVKEADNTVLIAERNALLLEPPIPWTWAANLTPAAVEIRALAPADAKALFINRFIELSAL
jgi:hypothetical protein